MAWHSLASRWAAADFASSSGTTIEVATLRRTRHVRSNRRCTSLGYPWLPDEARRGPLGAVDFVTRESPPKRDGQRNLGCYHPEVLSCHFSSSTVGGALAP